MLLWQDGMPPDVCLAISAGLDSFQAEKVVRTLQKLAQDGHTVVRFCLSLQ
jgi:hypothetical protein